MLIDGNNFISHHLKNNIPFVAGKIGLTELKLLYCYYHNNKKPNHDAFVEGHVNSGIFPLTNETFINFCETYIESIKSLNVAPIWGGILRDFHKQLFQTLAPSCYDTRLQDLEPYYFDNPWSVHLKDKNVLVISSFTDSIKKQYSNLDKIWNNKIKANFHLDTIKFPLSQGLTDKKSNYANYSELLNDMKNQILKKNFDICIIGAGAYALPLCSYMRSLNKSCIHLGGAIQILFGIRGLRWDDSDFFKPYYNEYWIRPSGDEIPEKYKLEEGGCYW